MNKKNETFSPFNVFDTSATSRDSDFRPIWDIRDLTLIQLLSYYSDWKCCLLSVFYIPTLQPLTATLNVVTAMELTGDCSTVPDDCAPIGPREATTMPSFLLPLVETVARLQFSSFLPLLVDYYHHTTQFLLLLVETSARLLVLQQECAAFGW